MFHYLIISMFNEVILLQILIAVGSHGNNITSEHFINGIGKFCYIITWNIVAKAAKAPKNPIGRFTSDIYNF